MTPSLVPGCVQQYLQQRASLTCVITHYACYINDISICSVPQCCAMLNVSLSVLLGELTLC